MGAELRHAVRLLGVAEERLVYIEVFLLVFIGRGRLFCFCGLFAWFALFVKQSVGGSKHGEFGTAVELVANLLLCLVEFLYEFLAEHVALLQPVVFFGELLAYGLGFSLP